MAETTTPSVEPPESPVADIARARWLRAYRCNQQIAVENMIARAEAERPLPPRADWRRLLTRTV